MSIEDDLRPRAVVSNRQDPLVAGLEPFDVFYRREIRRLIGLAYALSGSRLAADDIAQEAMLAAFGKWDEVGRLDSPIGWVRRVVANQAASAVRRRVAEAKRLSRLSARQPLVELPEIPAEASGSGGKCGVSRKDRCKSSHCATSTNSRYLRSLRSLAAPRRQPTRTSEGHEKLSTQD